MDKRLMLKERQAEVVGRIKEIFDELQKEGLAYGVHFAEDHLESNSLDFINAQEVIEFGSSCDDMVD